MQEEDIDDFLRMIEEDKAENPLRVLGLSTSLVEQIPDEYLVEFAEAYVNRVLAKFFHPDTGRVSDVDFAKYNVALDRLRENTRLIKEEFFSEYEKDFAAGKQLKKVRASRKRLLRRAQALAASTIEPREACSLLLDDENTLDMSFDIWEIDSDGYASVASCRIDVFTLMADYDIGNIAHLYDELEKIDAIGADKRTSAEVDRLGKLQIQFDKIDNKYHQLVDEHPNGEGLSGNDLRTYRRWMKLHNEIGELISAPEKREVRRKELQELIAENEKISSDNLWLHYDEDGDWIPSIAPDAAYPDWVFDTESAQWQMRVVVNNIVERKRVTEIISSEPYGLLADKVSHPAIKVLGSIKLNDEGFGQTSTPALSGAIEADMSALGLVRLPAELSEKAILNFDREFEKLNRLLCLVRKDNRTHYYYSNGAIAGNSSWT